jgi:hypothetical protein
MKVKKKFIRIELFVSVSVKIAYTEPEFINLLGSPGIDS